MAFDIDVLILYAEADNHIPKDSDNGWVTDFKRFVELMLIQVLGDKPNILLKSESDSITGANLKKVGTLIPILSPDFIASGECLDTLEEFVQLNKKDKVINVFKVFKKPLTIEEQPAKLRELIGYDLFKLNEDTGESEDYIDFFSIQAERDFWMKMVDLAYDLHERLLVLKESGNVKATKSIYSRRSIYLAETGHDLTIQRNIIKRELQRHGYKVLPDHTLPQNNNDLIKVVKKEIEESSLSIHLIGNSYGDIPEGSDKSVVDIQNQLASEKSISLKDKSVFSRLIWISPKLQHASEKQLAFIESIKRDLASTQGAEILQTPLEDFKNIVREELIEVGIEKKLSKRFEDSTNGKQSIYILHDRIDKKEVDPIKKLIEKSGYKVLLPAFDGELLELRQHHIANLRNFDAAIIYQNKVNNQWVRMKLLDLLKAPGFGRRKPIKGKAIISNVDDKIDLSTYENYDITLITGDKKGAMDSLNVFLEELN